MPLRLPLHCSGYKLPSILSFYAEPRGGRDWGATAVGLGLTVGGWGSSRPEPALEPGAGGDSQVGRVDSRESEGWPFWVSPQKSGLFEWAD